MLMPICAGWDGRIGAPSFDVSRLLQPLGLRMPESLRELASADRLCLSIPGLAVFYIEAGGSLFVGSWRAFTLTEDIINRVLPMISGPNGPLRDYLQTRSSTPTRAAIQPASSSAPTRNLPSAVGGALVSSPSQPRLSSCPESFRFSFVLRRNAGEVT